MDQPIKQFRYCRRCHRLHTGPKSRCGPCAEILNARARKKYHKRKKEREWWKKAQAKRRERIGPEAVRAERDALIARITTKEALEARAKRVGECLLWQGSVAARYSRVVPMVACGVRADTAMFERVFGRKPYPKHFVKQRCGNELCIEPSHLYESNRTLERALRLIDDPGPSLGIWDVAPVAAREVELDGVPEDVDHVHSVDSSVEPDLVSD